jgi:hypothetical protein
MWRLGLYHRMSSCTLPSSLFADQQKIFGGAPLRSHPECTLAPTLLQKLVKPTRVESSKVRETKKDVPSLVNGFGTSQNPRG